MGHALIWGMRHGWAEEEVINRLSESSSHVKAGDSLACGITEESAPWASVPPPGVKMTKAWCGGDRQKERSHWE